MCTYICIYVCGYIYIYIYISSKFEFWRFGAEGFFRAGSWVSRLGSMRPSALNSKP